VAYPHFFETTQTRICTAGFLRAFEPSQLRGGLIQKMKMINDKNDCIDSIIKMLERTGAWRKAITAKFPNDPRNKKAADTLDKLADEVVGMTDEQWESLSTYYSWTSENWRNALSHTARGVGFHYRAGDLKFFVSALIQQLSLSSSVAA
jgi:hypothetical protein